MHLKFCLCLVGVLVCGGVSAQTAPKLLPFQGRLTDAAGVVITDGAKVVQFKIYSAPVGGQAVWNGEVQKLTVNGGLVNTILGSKASLTGVDFNQNLYLELTLDANNDGQITLADPPLLPRQSILPAVFAKEAQDSRTLAGQDWTPIFGTNNPNLPIPATKLAESSLPGSKIISNSISAAQLAPGLAIPVGGVIMWWGTLGSIPPNFEICDGGPPTTLGQTLGGNKPDLRDRFVKGATSATTDVKATPVTGGAHILNLEHDHEMNHSHDAGALYVPISGGPRGAIWFGEVGVQAGYARGSVEPGYGWVIGPTRGTSGEEQQNVKPGTAVIGNTATASRIVTGPTRPYGANPPLTGVDNRPAFLQMFFIIRVK